jgi:hypothetical protein
MKDSKTQHFLYSEDKDSVIIEEEKKAFLVTKRVAILYNNSEHARESTLNEFMRQFNEEKGRCKV